MDTLEKARATGFVVLLDGKIGRETYCSITGSPPALERFEALCSAHPAQMHQRRWPWHGSRICNRQGILAVKVRSAGRHDGASSACWKDATCQLAGPPYAFRSAPAVACPTTIAHPPSGLLRFAIDLLHWRMFTCPHVLPPFSSPSSTEGWEVSRAPWGVNPPRHGPRQIRIVSKVLVPAREIRQRADSGRRNRTRMPFATETIS